MVNLKIPMLTDYILIVDDEIAVANLLKTILEREGEIDVVLNGEDGLKKISEKDFDLIVSDINLPLMDGLSFYLKSVDKHPDLKGKFLFLSGGLSPENLSFLEEHEIQYLLKPTSVKDMRIAAKKILLFKQTHPSSSSIQ